MLFTTLTFSLSTATAENPATRKDSDLNLIDQWQTNFCASFSGNVQYKYNIALQQCTVIDYPNVNVCEDFLYLPERDRLVCEEKVEKSNQ